MSAILQNGLTDGVVFVILATSFFLIFSVSKVLHFAHGTSYLIGAYVGYSVLKVSGSVLLSLLAAIICAGVFGLLCERFVYRPLRSRGATNMVLLIASLAIFIVGENIVGILYGSGVINTTHYLQQDILRWGTVDFSGFNLLSFVGVAAWLGGLLMVLSRTSIGLYIRATAAHQTLAELTGINSNRVRVIVFLVASGAAGFTGLVRFADVSGSPNMSLTGTLYAMVPFIVGGTYSIWGSVFGGLIIGFGVNVFAAIFGSEWTEASLFALLALVLLFRPQGILAARGR